MSEMRETDTFIRQIQEDKKMSEKINDQILEKVSGGVAEPEDQRKNEFETAWYGLGMETKGFTGTELEDLFAQWKRNGFVPDAKTFLMNCKTL